MENKLVQMRLELAQLKFANGDGKGALKEFIASYELSGDEEIFQLIMETYYLPNQNELENTKKRNMALLERYPHYEKEADWENQKCVPVWEDVESIIYVNCENHTFQERRKNHLGDTVPGNIAAIVNAMWMGEIEVLERDYHVNASYLDAEYPFYLIYDAEHWDLFLQLWELKPLLEKDRCVFLIGKNSCRKYLERDFTLLPDTIWADEGDQFFSEIVEQVAKTKEKCQRTHLQEVKEYYAGHAEDILQRVKNRTPKILFFTSRFSTAIQFHTKDCMRAAESMGLECVLLIEPDRLHRMRDGDIIKKIWEEKPDMIFQVDHLRCEYTWMPKELFFVSWFQDPMEVIFNKDTPGKLGERDYCLNHFTTWKKFFAIGYPEDKLMEGAIPANQNIYRCYSLSGKEKQEYECDICFVCHASDADGYVTEILPKYPKQMQSIIEALYKEYHNWAYRSGRIFYAEEDFAKYVTSVLQVGNENMPGLHEVVSYIAYDMYQWYNQRVLREALVDWLLDAGYTSIKLWGNGWKDNPKYADYAMGPAENGETLSKIYQASRIVLGNNCLTTAAARAWEAMLSGAFYMSNYIPPEDDVTDIRKIVNVDKELIMFRDRDDLLRKVDYYLSNEQERRRMAAIGQKVAAERMTYDRLMQRTIETIAERC